MDPMRGRADVRTSHWSQTSDSDQTRNRRLDQFRAQPSYPVGWFRRANADRMRTILLGIEASTVIVSDAASLSHDRIPPGLC